MNRLTENYGKGAWGLKGVLWKDIFGGVITSSVRMELNIALFRLKEYEDTGLTPDQIREMDQLYREKCEELAALKKQNSWIPVEEKLPETDAYILLSFANCSDPLIGRYEVHEDGSGAFYLDDCDGVDTCAANDLFVDAWMPLPEADREET